MPGDGTYEGAAAFLGGLDRGMDLGRILADRSQRQQAQTLLDGLRGRLRMANAKRQENIMRIGELNHLRSTTGIDNELFAEFENRILNTVEINAAANLAARDAISDFALRGGTNKYVMESTKQVGEELNRQEAADFNMVQQFQSAANAVQSQQQEGEKLNEERRSNKATETEAERSARATNAENIRGNDMQFQIGTERNDIEYESLEHQKAMDVSGTFAQRSEAVARREQTSVNWAGQRTEDRRLSMDGIRQLDQSAQAWAAQDRDERRDQFDKEQWKGEFQYRAYRDGVATWFKAERLKLDTELANNTIGKTQHDKKMAELEAKTRERALDIEEKRHDDMLAFNKDIEKDSSKRDWERIGIQKDQLELAEDELDSLNDERGARLWLDQSMSAHQKKMDVERGAREDRHLTVAEKGAVLQERRADLEEQGFDLDKLKTYATIQRYEAARKQAEREYDDLDEGIVDQAFRDAGVKINQKISEVGGDSIMDDAAVRMRLDPNLDSEEIKLQLASEEANLMLDEIRSAARNEKPERKRRQELPERARGLRAAELKQEKRKLMDDIEANPDRGVFGRIGVGAARVLGRASYSKGAANREQLRKATERITEIDDELEEMESKKRDRTLTGEP
jgi:hypothetical protein